ncbi:hypothetical protein [uncultured Chryseobacterium sp.]|uniref:hypothetical protein n=1 Tax=uncultured Chryseobacterium sp. TaxID=259322 RepID=UPI0025F252BE|nr:hypothetical protein [uncultured Chryseobacterium sp.]
MRFLILSFLFIISCKDNNAKATDKKTTVNTQIEDKKKTITQTDWSGKWIYEKKSEDADVPEEQFTLTIVQEGNLIKAQYCAIANSGGKIDCESTKEYNVSGEVRDRKITGEFFSFFDSSGKKGRFEIASINNNEIQWKVISPPQGTFYAPDRCTLARETRNIQARNSENKSINLLPVDYKDLESKVKFSNQPEEWLQKSFMKKFDLTADGSAEIFSKDGYEVYLIENMGGDSELVYLISVKGKSVMGGINVADSNAGSNTVKTFSINEKYEISIFAETNGHRKLSEKYVFNKGEFKKQ